MEVAVTLINVNGNNSAYVLCVNLALLNLCVTLAAKTASGGSASHNEAKNYTSKRKTYTKQVHL